jgi:hypothetical protein
MILMGSPGTAWINTNAARVIPMMTGTDWSSRTPKKRSI